MRPEDRAAMITILVISVGVLIAFITMFLGGILR
jgi:Cu/Ag efflux pump CusA